jgi:hypothetical protein
MSSQTPNSHVGERVAKGDLKNGARIYLAPQITIFGINLFYSSASYLICQMRQAMIQKTIQLTPLFPSAFTFEQTDHGNLSAATVNWWQRALIF